MSSTGNRPNFVVILADDLGYGDLSCYGRQDLKTPNLDQMAAEGMRFTDFHSNGAVCSPTRAALLTGRYQQRAEIEWALSRDEPGLPRDSVTLPQRLGEADYTSAVFGKWHLGDDIKYNPVHYGFDEFRGHTYGDSDYISHVDRHGNPDWWHNLERKEEEGYNTALLTDHSVRFIEQNTDAPFFLYLAHSAIHFPWMLPDDPPHRHVGTDYTDWHPDIDLEMSKLGPHQNVGPVVRRMIEELDRSVGRVLGALENTGQERDTFVLFASDNGGYRHYAGLHEGDISSNGPLRGQKADMYEGGHRVPAIIRWPGMIEPDSETDETTLTMDIFPTFLDMIDLEQNTGNPALDGVSILPVLLEGKALPRRPLFWKMREGRAVRDGAWKLVQNGDDVPELYNLEEDIGETQDLTPQNPARVEKLVGQLEEWETDVGPR